MDDKQFHIFRLPVFIGAAIFLTAAARDFYAVARGTGSLLGVFSLKWFVGILLFSLFLLTIQAALWATLWGIERWKSILRQFTALREKTPKYLLYAFAPILIIFPVFIFQYTLWGLIFTSGYIRFLLWFLVIFLIATLLTKDEEKTFSWNALLLSLTLTGTSYTLASVFSNVSSYPFNLFWSDGNRLWDYSLVFGREIYDYPADKPIPSLTSFGRQVLWGLPFLIPNSSIFWNRFWSAVVYSLPYMILGWVALKTEKTSKSLLFFLGLWAFLFLNQGPIYSPLVISAILVALAWRRPLWLAIPLVAAAGYYAEATRWTWEFAPAIWIGTLEIAGIKLKQARLALKDWARAMILGASGIFLWIFLGVTPNLQEMGLQIPSMIFGAGIGIFLLFFLGRFFRQKPLQWQPAPSQKKIMIGVLLFLSVAALFLGFGKIFEFVAKAFSSIQASMTMQPLIWSRLLPNDTYPEGVLGALLLAILPILTLLFYWWEERYWQPSSWQKVVILGGLLAFLAVGIVISTKIGGGNNLHNLDMFLISLFFTAVIAWHHGGDEWFAKKEEAPLRQKILLLLLLILPSYSFLFGLRPRLALTDAEIQQVQILAKTEIVDSLPSTEKIYDAIWFIRHAINDNIDKGEILFIDQRQLLTFGYVPKIPLVAEYEKKVLMNEAMSSNAAYFAPYYQDLANHRFSLIITEPLKVDIKNEEGVFAAENDLWTVWVSAPTLCYYEPLYTFWDVYVQLLVPRQEAVDCTIYTEK